MNKKEVIVQKEQKLSKCIQDFGFSFVDVNKILRKGDAKVDGAVTKKDVELSCGQKLTFFYSDKMLEKKFEVVFESDNVLVVFKFAGIESDGEKGLESVLNVLPVHRLDRNTEGLIIFAKNEKSQKLLEKSFKNHQIFKFYLAEVVGKFETDKIYNAFLVKDAQNSYVKIFDKSQKGAVPISTKIRTLKTNAQTSLLEVELLTGKTHQIRAHLAHLSHPIVGDGKYGKNEENKKFGASRQKLCCYKLKFGFVGIDELDFKEFVKFPKWANFEIQNI